MNSELKTLLLAECHNWVEERHARIKKALEDIRIALLEESKSSAGDKHETGRAMLQIERENAGKQLRVVENIKETLQKINIEGSSEIARMGSLVKTTDANYFISVSVGAIIINETTYYAVSPSTPIGQLLLGKQQGEELLLNTKKSHILEIN